MATHGTAAKVSNGPQRTVLPIDCNIKIMTKVIMTPMKCRTGPKTQFITNISIADYRQHDVMAPQCAVSEGAGQRSLTFRFTGIISQ